MSAASHQKSLHLLRALLREASYLPDAVARTYFRRYIVSRFKAYQPKSNATASVDIHAIEKYRHRSFKRRHIGIINQRTTKLQSQARKGLHFLQRANQGQLPCLQKALYFAYGRMGRRRYALMADLLQPDPLMDVESALAAPHLDAPSPLQKLYYSNKQYLRYFDAPKVAAKGNYTLSISDHYSRLRAVLKSQHNRGLSIHRALKGPVMKTPIHNIWMRPMPIKRARNNVRRWYAETMTRLLPPIPAAEWDAIHAITHKEEKVSLVRRRTPASSNASPNGIPTELDSMLEKLKMDKLSKAERPTGMWRPSTITPKFMQRLYSRILQLCCKVEYNPERKQWAVVWGEPIQSISPRIYQVPSDESLFAGVDVKGRVASKPKETDTDAVPKIQPRNQQGEYVRFPFFTEYLPEDNPLRQELDSWKKKRAAVASTTPK